MGLVGGEFVGAAWLHWVGPAVGENLKLVCLSISCRNDDIGDSDLRFLD